MCAHASDPPGLTPDGVHILNVGIHVFRSDVSPAQTVDEAAEGAEECLRLDPAIADDHGLAPTEVQTGNSGLVGHSTAEAEHIAQGIGLIRVIVETAAAEGWAQGRVMDRDDRSQSTLGILRKEHLLVTKFCHGFERKHTHLAEGECITLERRRAQTGTSP